MKYLTARKLVADPWMEIYENENPNKAPVQLSYSPALPGKIGRAAFSPDQQTMAVTSDLRVDQIPGAIGNPANTYSTAGPFVYAPDSSHILFFGAAGSPAKAPTIYGKMGPFFQRKACPIEALTPPLQAAAVNEKGHLIAVAVTEASVDKIKFYQFDGNGGWNFLVDKTPGFITRNIQFLDNAFVLAVNDLAFPGTSKLYKVEDNLPELALPVAGAVRAVKKMPGGAWRFVINDSISTVRVYDLVGTTFTLVQAISISGTGFVRLADITSNGDCLAVYFTTTSGFFDANLRVYGWNGTTYVSTGSFFPTGTTPSSGTLPTMLFSPDGQALGCGFGNGSAPGNRANLYKRTAAATPTFALAISNTTGTNGITAFSPNSGIAHWPNLHVSTASPYATLTNLPFAPGVPANTINGVKYAPGSDVGWRVGANFNGAAQDGGGGYIDYTELDGTFVTIYDRDVDTFIERAYVQHLIGTKIRDIVFSATSKVLSYHCYSEDPGRITGLGRFVYNIADKEAKQFELKGAIYREGDLDSKIAYSPAETHFVVSYTNTDDMESLRLYKFSAGYAYTEVDVQGVMFGPVAYSHCETVLVAHGGAKPYSLYAVAMDELIPQTVIVTDWDVESIFLTAGFTGDCNGIVLVPPDKVITITDPTTPKPADEEPIDDPLPVDPGDDGEFPVIIPDPDTGGVIIIVVPGTGDPNPPGQWEVPDGGGSVVNVVYFPYTVTQTTFRTW